MLQTSSDETDPSLDGEEVSDAVEIKATGSCCQDLTSSVGTAFEG